MANQKKKKILLFSTAYLPLIGGSELAIKNITDRLPDFQFDLITARFKRQYPKFEKIDNVNVYRVGLGFGLDKFLLPILGCLRAQKLVDSDTILHAYQASYGAMAACYVKMFDRKLPLILSFQEGKNLDRQNFLLKLSRRIIIARIDKATAISSYLKKYLNGIRKNLPIEIVPNGVDFEHFSREFSYGELTKLAEELGIKADEKVIITVSRLVPKNGVDILIEAGAVMRDTYPDLKFKILIIGEGNDREKLERISKEKKLDDVVVFMGRVNYEETPKLLKISTVFARLSRSEGLGNAFLEAMAAGISVVGTPVGGIPDFLVDGETGLMAKPEDVEDTVFQIHKLLVNKELRESISDRAKILVREKYTWDEIAEQFRKLYQLPFTNY